MSTGLSGLALIATDSPLRMSYVLFYTRSNMLCFAHLTLSVSDTQSDIMCSCFGQTGHVHFTFVLICLHVVKVRPR